MKKHYAMMIGLLLPLALLLVILAWTEPPVQAAPPARPLYNPGDCVVTDTVDSGAGSLRSCILQLTPGDTITFDTSVFSTTNPATITLLSALPIIITDSITIDGSSAGVILDGSGTPGWTHGLVIDGASNVVIKGLQILNFPGGGISLQNGASNNTIGGTNATPGGSCTGDCNLISGNTGGVGINGSGTMNNTVSGNYIGTNINGTAAISNTTEGVVIIGGAQYNVIGGDTAGERNLISGNGLLNVRILGSGTMSNTVSGNYIGTDASGTVAVGNTGFGVGIANGPQYNVIGGDTAGERNLISGNGSDGIRIQGGGTMNNTVSGNYIGTNASGTAAIGNGGEGVYIVSGASYNVIGGDTAGERNLISGNSDGVLIGISSTMSNTVSGNYIGTDINGTAAIGNGGDGVYIVSGASYNVIGGGTAGERNIITYNGQNGISIQGGGTANNTVQNNWIGIDADSTGGLDPRDLVVANDGTVFLANFGRGVFKSIDSAASWQAANNGLTTLDIDILAVSPNFASDRRVWAWGNGKLFVSNDAGANWSLLSSALPGDLNALEVSPNYTVDQTLLAAVEGHGIYKSTDGGGNWVQTHTTTNADNIAFSPNFATDQVVLVGKGWYGVFRSTDGGDTWVESNSGLPNISVFDIAFAPNGQTVFLASDNCTNDGVYRSTDAGQTWTASGTGLGDCGPEWQIAVSPEFATDGLVFAAEDQTFRSTDGGSNWSWSGDGTFGSRGHALAFSPAFATDKTVYFANFVSVFRTIDGGDHWTWAAANLGDRGNRYKGVEIGSGAGANRVLGNVIGRNGNQGILIWGSEAAGSLVDGNVVGLAPDGVTRAANGGTNIRIETPYVTVTNNTSSAGSHGGLRSSTAAHHLTITGNRFGTDVSGTMAIGNSYDGITLESSWDIVCDNIFSGNWGDGIGLKGAHHVTVTGNYVGTDSSGTATIGNTWDGILIYNGAQYNVIGGDMASERNLISGSGYSGVSIQDSGTRYNIVKGNYIGTDVNGTAAIGNTRDGIEIRDGASYNVIGGDAAGERNLISGNGESGVVVNSSGTMHNTVRGNYIGTDASGAVALGNAVDGVSIGSGAQYNTIGPDNIIVSNGRLGLLIAGVGTTHNTVKDNFIGTNSSSATNLGNAEAGVLFVQGAQGNTAGPGNTVAYNVKEGVVVLGSTSLSNTITSNSIHSNSGKGIELYNGGNKELSPPIITNLLTDAVSGRAVPNSTVEVFSDNEDEGRVFEGSTTADGSGNFTFNKPGGFTLPHVTATATDSDGNTSEFSAVAKPGVLLYIGKSDFPDPVAAGSSLTYTITISETGGTVDATGVQVTDTVPANTTCCASIGQGGALVGSDVVWTGKTVSKGSSLALTFVVTVGQVHTGTIITNDAYRVVNSDQGVTTSLGSAVNTTVFGEAGTETGVIDPEIGGTVVYTDPNGLTTSIEVPGGAVTDTTLIQYTPQFSPSVGVGGFLFAGHAFMIEAFVNGVLQPGFVFSKPVTITIHYADTDVEGLNESMLLLYTWDGSKWVPMDTCGWGYRHDPANNVIQVQICHLSEFALFGEKPTIRLPIILK